MKQVDIRFDGETINRLHSMIGQDFEKIRCDPFDYSPMVYGFVGLYIGGNVYKLQNYLEEQDYFGNIDDVAMLKLVLSVDSEIESGFIDVEMIDIPICSKIKQIRLVEENQRLYVNGEQTYNVWLTRGLIFDLEDGREVSFEKSVWFSEFIHVQRGYDLLKTYQSTDEFLEEWEENEGYRGECDRVIRTLS